MFVYTLKATTLKYIGVMTLCIVAVVTTVAIVPSNPMSKYSVDEMQVSAKVVDFKGIKTLKDREEFLKCYGWDIDTNSETVREFTLPEDFDEVYFDYNKIQLSEGLNLEKYKGKDVKCYTYFITNYPDNTPAVANVLVYKGRVIGGDVSSPDINSFQHGFSRP